MRYRYYPAFVPFLPTFTPFLLGLLSTAVAAATAAPPGLENLREAFASAVAAKDRIAVANLSRFPLAVEVYESAPTLSRQKFLDDRNYFDGWFFSGDPELLKCLKTEPFAYQADKGAFGSGTWYLDCNGNEYYFGQQAGRWAFFGYQNINE